MNKPLLFRAAASLMLMSLISACNSEPENITAGGPEDPDAAKVAAAPPVQLPPMMTASKSYRCKDNSVVYIDFFNNNTLMYKAKKEDTTGTTLTAEAEGKPYTADGYSVSGNGSEVTIAAPGKGSQSCKA